MAMAFPFSPQDPVDAGPDAPKQSKLNAAIETFPDTLDAVLIAELRESQRMLATLLSNLHGMAYRCKNDPEWTMEYISEGCLELTGYPPSALINSPSIAYGHLIDPADRIAVWDAVQIGLRAHEPFQITYRLHTAAGTQRWVHERGRGVYGADGELLALEGYITDVTDLQRSQDALHRAHQDLERRVMARTAELELANQRLREQEARFHALADHAGDAIFVVDQDGIIVYANERAAALTGLDATHLLRQPFAGIAPPDVQPVLAGRLHQCLTGGPVPNPFETNLLNGATSVPVELNEVRSRWMEVDVDIIIARDISERKRAVLALQRERQFTDTILDTVAMWVVVIDVSGNIIHLNRACEMATGLSLEEIRGKCFWNFFVPAELRARVSASFATWPVEPMPRTYESTFTTHDGKDRHIAWQIGAAYGDDGSAAYYIGAGMDITERQELEELRIKEQVIEASLVPIGMSDLQGKILYVNPALVRRWGYAGEAEIVGRDYTVLFRYPDQAQAAFAQVNQTGAWTGKAVCVMQNGEHFITLAAANLVTNSAGKPILVTSSLVDLSEIHDAQTALAASEHRYRRIVETAQEGVWMIDAGSRTTFANTKMGEILGWQPDEMLGLHLFEFMDEDGRRIAEHNLERRRQGMSEQHEFKFLRKDGSFVWALLGTNPILDDNGAYCGALAMVTDITERKRTEAALAHYATELEQSNQDLEQFAYVASHDLQEPLRMVASYVQLLARQYQGKLDAEADQYIGYAVDGAKRMQRLIQDLLALSRISTRPQIMRNIDCETVLAEALKNLQLVIEDTGASITHTPLPVVNADRGQLVQLFQNVIGNALKFHGDTPPHVHIDAELEPGDGAVEPPHWLFRISDNGIGIDPQYFDRIFEVFQRLHNRDEYSGTGIGLAICRRIVERHGGHIGVISTPGDGATFVFTLPVNVTNALNDCDSDRRG